MTKGEIENDPWALPELKHDDRAKWNELSTSKKVFRILLTVVEICSVFILLYLFVCSLSLLSSAFRLIGGKSAGQIFANSEILSNPIAGLMMGILGTVLVQSSSTTTSIIVTMVSAGLLKVKQGNHMMMGANVGTSVTNTIVSLTQMADRDEFRRAFAAATVHDMFNWLTVIILLPTEAITAAIFGEGYLDYLSAETVKLMPDDNATLSKGPDFLKVITKPLTSQLIKLDKKIINKLATGADIGNATLNKKWCDKQQLKKCGHLFNLDSSDLVIGIIVLVIALTILFVSLILMVRLLHNLLRGQIVHVIRSTVNADFPGIFSCLTGYMAIVVGTIFTILVQSSSIFTSTLTPLVGVGVLTIERAYPLTLGSNVGTCATAIIAALATDTVKLSLQVALFHLFFNLTGILMWYPIPFFRQTPIRLSKFLGNTTAHYRWFSIVYLVFMFGVLPAIVFGLSLAGWPYLLAVGVVLCIIICCFLALKIIQNKCPESLPENMRDFNFLPEWMRSLEPYDRVIMKAKFLCCSCKKHKSSAGGEIQNGSANANDVVANGDDKRCSSTTSV